MKILRATHLGMCFGVRDAIAIASHEAQKEPVTVLGQLVHNPAVLRDLQRGGVQLADAPDDIRTASVLISAHGTSDRTRTALADRGLRVIETTCPLVHFAHRMLRDLVNAGYHPVVIGKRDHVEVRGLTDDLPECDVVLTENDLRTLTERPRFGVVAQTTQPTPHVNAMVNALKRRFPRSEVRFSDTVCRPTKQRQQAAIELARKCDIVVVAGGDNSNNTRELAATCRRYCSRICRVQSANELHPDWFRAEDTVGITAGTSTPDSVVETIAAWLHQLADRLAAEISERSAHWAHGPSRPSLIEARSR